MSDALEPPPPPNALRLCHIRKWANFEGYGFNLHAEKGKPGQYIGKVDAGSPAEAAGLREGDRIVEVNAVNIANENHKQVVQRIKAMGEEARLLVVDPEGDAFFKARGILLKSSLPSVVHLATPPQALADVKNHDLISQGEADRQDEKLKLSQEDDLNLKITAKELRAQLAAKKKFDPKKQSMDLKKKYDIVQKL